MSEKKTPNERLEEAIAAGIPQSVREAIAAGADVINGTSKNPLTPAAAKRLLAERSFGRSAPMFEATQGKSVAVVEVLIKAIIEKSQVPGNSAQAEQNIARNLLDRTVDDEPLQRTLIECAAASECKGMLAAVWPYFKAKNTINHAYAGGKRLLHAAVGIYPNLKYLLDEGADINVADREGATPLMYTFSYLGSHDAHGRKAIEELLTLYEKHHADWNAVDNKGRNAIYYLLNATKAYAAVVLYDSPVVCLELALKRGINALTKDREGKTALDYFVETQTASHSGLRTVLEAMAAYGYNADAVLQKYISLYPTHSKLKDIRAELHTIRVRILNKLTGAAILRELWNKDGSPSGLLLSVCGYEALAAVFEHPSLQKRPAAAFALYQKMEATLPPQCQDFLRNGFDKTFLRDVAQPPKSSAVLSALRRKKPVPEKGLGR